MIVKGDQLLASGSHLRAGSPHAEVVALSRCGKEAKSASLFVTLEPCAHHGRTPPCVEAIVKAGIKEVYAAITDPNPQVAGKGFAYLKAHGVGVHVGCLSAKARTINEGYLCYFERKRPWVTLKLALSADGWIADLHGGSRWLSGERSRRRAHLLRFHHDAVAVGATTVINDDPLLTVRTGRPRLDEEKMRLNYLRVVVDGAGKIPVRSRLVATASQVKTLWIGQKISQRKALALAAAGVETVRVRGKGITAHQLFSVLKRRKIQSLLVEGGGGLARTFLSAGMVDRLVLIYAPRLLGTKGRPMVRGASWALAKAPAFRWTRVSRCGDDIWLEGESLCLPESSKR